jgi:hypothetical protein
VRSSATHLRALGVATALASAIACNAFLDLDGHSARPFVLTDGGDGDSGAEDAGVDAERPPEGTVAQSWAKWRMPSEVVDAGEPATDSGLSRFRGAYTNVGMDISLDVGPRSAPLVFHKVHGRANTFAKAALYCKGLSSGVGNEYRVPTRIELVTFLNFDALGRIPEKPLIPAGVESSTADPYWTASYVQPVVGALQHWFVNPQTGAVRAQTVSSDERGVACIKGEVQ